MRRQLRALAAAEEQLQASADAAVRAVSATLSLLSYGGGATAARQSDAPLAGALPTSLDNQLRHCHVLAAGVVQVSACIVHIHVRQRMTVLTA